MVLQKLRIVIILSIASADGENRHDFQKSFLVDHCDKIYSLACFKLDVAKWLDKVDVNSEIFIIPGVSILQAPKSVRVLTSDIAAEVAREFPDDPDSRVDNLLARKLKTYLSNHVMKINLGNRQQDTVLNERKERGHSNYLPAVVTTIIGVIGAIIVGGITALGGKAFIASSLALALSALIGVRELISRDEKIHIIQTVPLYTSSTPTEWEEYAERRKSTQGFLANDTKLG